MGVEGDGVSMSDVTECQAGYDSACVAFGDVGEVGGVVEKLGKKLVAFLQGEKLVGYAFGLAHEFVDEFSLAAPYICGK